MRTAPRISLSKKKRILLESITGNSNEASSFVERARIVLMAADGLENREIGERVFGKLNGHTGGLLHDDFTCRQLRIFLLMWPWGAKSLQETPWTKSALRCGICMTYTARGICR